MSNLTNYGSAGQAGAGSQGCVASPVGLGQGLGNIMSSTGGAVEAKQAKPQVTHIELRRVQNGFVVMAINAEVQEQYALYRGPQRWSFVAKDMKELGDLLTSIVDGNDIEWMPTYDLPIIDLHRRVEQK